MAHSCLAYETGMLAEHYETDRVSPPTSICMYVGTGTQPGSCLALSSPESATCVWRSAPTYLFHSYYKHYLSPLLVNPVCGSYQLRWRCCVGCSSRDLAYGYCRWWWRFANLALLPVARHLGWGKLLHGLVGGGRDPWVVDPSNFSAQLPQVVHSSLAEARQTLDRTFPCESTQCTARACMRCTNYRFFPLQ